MSRKYDFSNRYSDIDNEFKRINKANNQSTTTHRDAKLIELVDYFGLTKTSGYSAVAMMIYWERGKLNNLPRDKEVHKKIVQNYVRKYPNKILVGNRKSISKKLQRSKTWKKLRLKALKKLGSVCMCCGSTGSKHNLMHVDHIIPKSQALHLTFDFNNLQILCSRCNGLKGTKTIDYKKIPKTY